MSSPVRRGCAAKVVVLAVVLVTRLGTAAHHYLWEQHGKMVDQLRTGRQFRHMLLKGTSLNTWLGCMLEPSFQIRPCIEHGTSSRRGSQLRLASSIEKNVNFRPASGTGSTSRPCSSGSRRRHGYENGKHGCDVLQSRNKTHRWQSRGDGSPYTSNLTRTDERHPRDDQSIGRTALHGARS